MSRSRAATGPYGRPLRPQSGASVDAAAAHDLLVHYFQARAAALYADLAASLATVPDGPAEQRGQAVGHHAAAVAAALAIAWLERLCGARRRAS